MLRDFFFCKMASDMDNNWVKLKTPHVHTLIDCLSIGVYGQR